MKVEHLDPTIDPRWAALTAAAPGSIFHSVPWLRVLADTYDFPTDAIGVCGRGGALVGGVPVATIVDALGPRLVALPFSDACDPLLMDDEAWPALLAELRAPGLPVHLRVVDEHQVRDDPTLTTTKRARWHRVELDRDEDELWAALDPSARRAVRRARTSGVVVRPIEGADELDQLIALHRALRKHKYRSFSQPPLFFHAMAEHFGAIGGWHPVGAFAGGRMVAATIYLRWGDTLVYKLNTSATDALHLRPNNLLLWEGIVLARRLGCDVLDLGPSDDDQPGLIRFKQNHGATASELRFLRHEPPGWHDAGGAVRSMLGEVTSALTEPWVPDEVTGRVGASLYRMFA